jgi:hypothetical protein
LKVSRAEIHVGAAAGLSVYLPLYWLSTTMTDACGNPEALTAYKVGLLLSVLAAYLLAPFALRILARYTPAAEIPSWLSVPAVGSAFIVLALVAFERPALTLFEAATAWLALSLWTMPASAMVNYLIKHWRRGPDYAAPGLPE